jgi:hypothetical protein
LRQAGDLSVDVFGFSNEALKPIERLGRDLADLQERWDNRLVLEKSSISELYVNGRIETVLYGDWRVGDQQFCWACRVASSRAIADNVPVQYGVNVADFGEGDGGQDQIVLVVVIKGVEGPQRFIRSVLRPYLIPKKFFGTGEGLLYRREVSAGYEVFPFGRHWEEPTFFRRGRVPGCDNRIGKMIQCSPEIVDSISDDEAERLWDWLLGPVGKLKLGRIFVSEKRVSYDFDFIERGVERRCAATQFINVAIGPLNL